MIECSDVAPGSSRTKEKLVKDEFRGFFLGFFSEMKQKNAMVSIHPDQTVDANGCLLACHGNIQEEGRETLLATALMEKSMQTLLFQVVCAVPITFLMTISLK